MPKPSKLLESVAVQEGGTPPTAEQMGVKRRRSQELQPKLFQVTPEAGRAFDILKAETGKRGPDLIAEALNLLFRKYGKSEMK